MKKSLQRKLQLRNRTLPIFIVVLLILAVIFPHKSWWIVFLSFGLALAFSYLSIYQLTDRLKIGREMRFGWAQVGDILEERINVQNTSSMPAIWLQIQDHTNLTDKSKSIGTSVGAHGHTSWRTQHKCIRRGLYRLGPTTIHTGDLFGLFELTLHDPAESNILITPPTVPLPQITVASGGLTGDGRLTKGVFEQSVAVSTVRDYQPLDPLNHIHWPLSAKRGELTSRIFENTPTGNWWIIQDMNQAVQVGEDQNNSLEIGIILAASLVNKGIRSGKAVGLIANDAQNTWIPPRYSGDQTMKLLRNLALSEPGDLSLKNLLKRSLSSFQQAASLVVITPDVSMSWWEPLIWLKSKGMTPTIIILDPNSFGAQANTRAAIVKLQNAGISCYQIDSDMFAEQITPDNNPLWEWRVFGPGYAIPVKKPQNPAWKQIQ